MPLASASCAPVSTVPWELKGREGANQDAGDPVKGTTGERTQFPTALGPQEVPPWHRSAPGDWQSSATPRWFVSLSHGGAGTWGFKEPGLRKVVARSFKSGGGEGGGGDQGQVVNSYPRTLRHHSGLVIIMAASCCFWWTYRVSDTSGSFMYFALFSFLLQVQRAKLIIVLSMGNILFPCSCKAPLVF